MRFSHISKVFRKCKYMGISLMDTGLGFYLFSHAIVSSEARGLVTQSRRTTILWNAGKEASVLLVLGFVRLIINSLFNKTSNVFEYGKHWNFFFTIAVVKFSSTSLLQFTPIFLHKYLGFIVIFLHQAALSTTAVRSFASKGWFGDRSRKGFIDANREGLISTIGFIGFYFIGVNFGRFLMKNRETVGDWLKCLCTLLFVCCLSWMSLQVSNVLLGKPSRRLANLPYALSMICIITSGIVQHIIYDIVVACCRPVVQRDTYGDSDPDSKDDIRCLLLEAVNYNGLLFFLVANLLTGLVNLAIDTKLYSSGGAFFVLTVYMFMLSATSLILYKNKISFKAIIFQKLLRLY
ncbi:phosphatidylinositol-glycan biosynthesis class W protein-like isoform X2 [Mya arenaria]|uniref:phosphatidylinositol-glycan biosynthesis class W protein-like isoform X2 n=1 Tax=Mya arenaria TaxID=6604 RepID=UPI0022E3C448|nr:phosphatidylinositol-glycan biosynthesis class W protein-like isoform X2 [Mya arenaria]